MSCGFLNSEYVRIKFDHVCESTNLSLLSFAVINTVTKSNVERKGFNLSLQFTVPSSLEVRAGTQERTRRLELK